VDITKTKTTYTGLTSGIKNNKLLLLTICETHCIYLLFIAVMLCYRVYG